MKNMIHERQEEKTEMDEIIHKLQDEKQALTQNIAELEKKVKEVLIQETA